jgi:hypothetical protein
VKTYGRLVYSEAGHSWLVSELSPHVAIAFKRLFPRVKKEAVELVLSDSDDVRADLEWFMDRYPLQCNAADATELDIGAERMRERIAERDKILSPSWKPGGSIGFRHGKAPFLYQQQAARIALANPGLLVGDDAGLGKTITAATICTEGGKLPAAVVCDAHLCRQWQAKLHEFTHLVAHVVKTRGAYNLPKADVYIFSWSKLIGWADMIHKGVFRTVIWDEIQELRTGTTTAKGTVSTYLARKAEVRVGLTATPVYNYGDEMHEVMSFIQAGLLGERDEFLREWCGNSRIVKDPDALGAYLRETGFFVRRTEDDEVVDVAWGQRLPPLNTLEWEVDCDDEAVADEMAMAKKLALTVMKGSFVDSGKASRELDIMMRQITGVAKARSVAAYVKMLLMDTPRVLVAGWHREVYSIWLRELERYQPVMFTGSETAAGKARAIGQFTEGPSRVMFMSLRSGKGVDGLQGYCQEAVVGEFDWSPQVHYQFFRRLRRPGMDPLLPVTGHYLHTDFGSDPVLMETLGIKADQSRGINDPGIAPKPRHTDDQRIKRLAQHVLEHGL